MTAPQPFSPETAGSPAARANRRVPGRRTNLWAAWLVHLFTASGVLAAFFAILAIFGGRYREALLWMVLATIVDAVDGALARIARVKEVLPGFDGARLDDIVDYLTFVFAPALLIFHSGTLPPGWGVPIASLILLSSAYGFASTDAKTHDHFFTGFPSYWNIVAVYLVASQTAPWFNAVLIVLLSALVFVRIGFVYPSRTPTLRRLTIALGLVWGAMVIAMILLVPDVPGALVAASLFFPIYYTVLSLVLHARRPGPGAAPA